MLTIGDRSLILAIDLGTSGPKVALVSIEGKILSSFFSPTTLIHTDDRGIEQDPNQWWQAIDEAVYNVFKNNSTLKNSILGIACTAQWSGTVALGHDGKPLMNAIIWMDARGKDSIKKINRFYPKISGYNLKNLYQWISKTGGAPGLSGKDSLAHILFIKENMSELYNRTYKFLEPKDYINFLLTGEIATSFDTMALHWITDNRDINAIRYDKSLLSIVGLEEEKFPSLLPSTQVLATLKKDLALRWNLPPQTPVMVGSPDVHTAAIGSGAIHDYEGHLCLGTSSWISCHVPFKKTSLTTNIASLPSALPGRYLVANEQQCASACLSFLQKLFLRDNFSKDLSYQSFETLAGQSQPGSQSLIFTPWINGERTPLDKHSVRGGFHNIYLKQGLEDFISAT